MRFDEDRKPPLWVEQGDDIYGHNLSPTEYLAELADRPHRPLALLPGGAGRRVSAATGTRPGVDRPVAPQHRASLVVPVHPSRGGDEPDLPSAA